MLLTLCDTRTKITMKSSAKPVTVATIRERLAVYDPRAVMAEQLQPLLTGTGTSLVSNAIVAIIIAAVMHAPEQAARARSWAMVCIAVVILSAISLWVVKNYVATPERRVAASWIMTIGSAIRGLTWGAGFLLLMPTASPYEQIMLGWAVAGLMCGGAFSTWSLPVAAAAFAGCAGLGGFLGMLSTPGVGETWMPYAVPVLFVFLMRAVMVSVNVLRQRVFAEKELSSKNDVISLLLRDFEENASDWLWEADRNGRLQRGADRFARVLELAVDKVAQNSLLKLSDIFGNDESSNTVFRERMLAGESFSNQIICFGIGNLDRYLKLSAKPLFDSEGALAGWHGVASDVTDERLADLKVRKLALFDTLTELPNRAFFYDRLEATLLAKSSLPGWVMYLDLDGFKAVNDTFGHATGDHLLRAVAIRLAGCLPTKGMLARLGGDEFSVICSGTKSRIDEYANRITASLAAPFMVGKHEINIGVSMGVAQVLDTIEDRDELMRRADVALYAAKHRGRGHVRYYDEDLDRSQMRRRDIEAALRVALAQELFVLHYQPIIEIQTGRTYAYEALLRFQTAELGAVPPDEFIPIAEESGLISDIGDWVIRKACNDAIHWPNDVCVAVNVSPLQLQSHRILAVVTSALSDSGLPPSRLELELTESALIENVEHTTRILSDLKSLGVRLALDDFGTGYSSLSHLHQFNFDKIKIDRSFVQSFGDRRESTAVVNAVVHLARDLGITMTAEGVETTQHLDAMRDAGCDHVQGYLLGRPEALSSEDIQNKAEIQRNA
jgi:diguanylate cyclase (GGDEF)-like protein